MSGSSFHPFNLKIMKSVKESSFIFTDSAEKHGGISVMHQEGETIHPGVCSTRLYKEVNASIE